MAIGVDEIKTVGKVVFSLVRGDESTSRSIDIPFPIVDTEAAQTVVNNLKTTFVESNLGRYAIQPSNWRDDDVTEKAWLTTDVRYEIITTSTTPITPEEVTP